MLSDKKKRYSDLHAILTKRNSNDKFSNPVITGPFLIKGTDENPEITVEFAVAHNGYRSKMIEIHLMELTICKKPKLRLVGQHLIQHTMLNDEFDIELVPLIESRIIVGIQLKLGNIMFALRNL